MGINSKTRLAALLGLVLLSPRPCRGDFNASGDAQVTGQLGVGTYVPRAQCEVRMGASDSYALKVSSQDHTALLVVDKTGKLGIMLASPQARMDISGSGDNGNIGLQLRVGNSSSTTLSSQLVFASSGTNAYAHSIRTRAVSSQNLGNSMDFFLWNSTAQPNQLGSLEALSLQAVPYASTASMHIMPVGTPDVELEVSNGLATGGGTMIRGSAGQYSSRELKTDIAYLDQAAELQAYQEVKALKHATFRYKAVQPGSPADNPILARNEALPLMRGLIYEDAPASIQGTGRTLVLDYRVMNLELALKEANRQIQALEARISDLEKTKRGKRR